MNKESTPTPPTDNDPFGTIRKPKWDEWNTTQRTRLWHAVALACDLDPSNYRQGDSPKLNPWLKELPKVFDDLLSDAKRNIGVNGVLKLVSKNEEGLEESEVKLSNFAAWLKSIGHQPPAEFPWQPETVALINNNWPWGGHETDLLRKLAAAADRFWKNYDPSDPSTAPINQEVEDWLEKQGIAVRNAKVIATILRADGLKTGPRK